MTNLSPEKLPMDMLPGFNHPDREYWPTMQPLYRLSTSVLIFMEVTYG